MQAIIFLSAFVSLVGGTDTYIYLPEAKEHPIKEYTGDENRFMDSSSPKVVEFYSPSCPVCVGFKPTYIKLATETTEKYPQIEFFAVSCDDHFDTCKEFGIDDFPTLKVYKAGDDSGTEITDEKGGYTMDHITELLDVPNEPMGADLQQFRRGLTIDLDDEPEGGVAKDVDSDFDEDDAGADRNEGESDGKEDGNDGSMRSTDVDNQETEPNGNGDGSDENIAADHEDLLQQFRQENEKIQEDQSDEDGDINDGEKSAPIKPEDEADAEGGMDVDIDGNNDEKRTYANDEDDNGSNDESGPISAELPKARKGGALHAKYKPMELDRYRDRLLGKLQEHDRKQKRKGFFSLFFGEKKDNIVEHTAESDALTKTMKVNTPGTEEFIARRKALNERIQKARKRWRNHLSFSNMTIGMLPYHKDVRGKRRPLFRSYAHLSEEEALILDVTHAFVMGLKYGLFLKSNQLDLPQINAFRDYLDLLGVSLPSEWRLHKLILDLRQNLVKVGKGRSNLLDVLDKYPFQEGWSTDCTKGRFTCGFWKLLHTSTVGVAENRGGLNLIESGLIRQSAKTFAPLEAADTIRNYIDHFFTCGPCRKEFIATYDVCEKNRRCDRLTEELKGASVADWKELPTWLWEVHNEVSVRVVKTRASQMNKGLPTKGKQEVSATEQLLALWPQINDCIACFKEDGSWNEAGIFMFLESKYW